MKLYALRFTVKRQNMRKKLICLVYILSCLQCFAVLSSTDIEQYRIPYNSLEEFQTLVGKTITYIPMFNTRNSNMKYVFGLNPMSFTVVNVKKVWSTKKKGRADWIIKDNETDKEYSLVVYYGEREALLEKDDIGDSYEEVRSFDIPFYMMIDSLKSKYIGQVFEHPLVKASYKIIDATIKMDLSQKPSLFVTVVNSIDNKQYTYDYANVAEKCFESDLAGGYTTNLIKVEKPENPEIKYGKIQVIADTLNRYSYEDNFIDINILGDSQEFSLSIKNKTQYSLKLIWDDAIFVDTYGTISKIMHSGIKYLDRESTQPASIIIRGARLEDVAIPTRNVYYDDLLKDWRVRSMYSDMSRNEVKQVQLMLPIQIKDVTNEYIFIFEIKHTYYHPEKLNLPQ